MNSLCIVGTGLIGASIGLALRRAGYTGAILGYDQSAEELAAAQRMGAVDHTLLQPEQVAACGADVFVLATPVLPVLDWMTRLAPVLGPHQFVTDVGSTKAVIAEAAGRLFPAGNFLPGHPMAGKERGGAALAEASLFEGAAWLFTPLSGAAEHSSAAEWRGWVERMGAHCRDLDPAVHDKLCAEVSHLPQFVSTALAAMLEDIFTADPALAEAARAIGGRALRETTRLGASPYSMWRDVALTNTENVAAVLHTLEQRLAHIRENLRSPQLREEFHTANRFRAK